MYNENVLGSCQPEPRHQSRDPSGCTWEAGSGQCWLTPSKGRRNRVGLRSVLARLLRVPTYQESSLLSSDLSSAGLLGDRGLDFRCPGPVSLQADLLSPYKRCLTKQAERTLCFCFCHFQIREVSSGLAEHILC